MKILHLEADKYSIESIEKLKRISELTIGNFNSQDEFVIHTTNNQYDAIFTRLGLVIDQSIIVNQPKLRFIVTPTTGLNHIDLELIANKNITLISLKGETEFLGTIKSTAEHTWTLLLSLIRQVIPAHNNVINNKSWERAPYVADELDGKNIGIIGYGRLGKIVANYALAFGMNVWVNDLKNDEISDNRIKQLDIDTLLKKSDYVLLMIAYEPYNKSFMDSTKFSMMKTGSYFVNTSRGEIVDEPALLEALSSGRIKGAALDVLNQDSSWGDSVDSDNKLIEYAANHTNLIITPHIGGYGLNSIMRTRDFVTDKFLNLIN